MLLLAFPFLLLQLSWVWKGAAQDMFITEVVINFFEQKKGIEKGMYTALNKLLINPVFATTPLQAAQIRTMFWYKQIIPLL